MDVKQIVVLALQVSIVATVSGFGLSATADDLLYLMRRPSLLMRSLVAVFVIMPAVAVALFRWLDFPQTTEVALVALAMSPVPPILPRRGNKAGWHTSYGLGLMVLLSLVAIATIPVTAAALEHVFGRSYTITPGPIARIVMKTTLLPLAIGMVIRGLWPALAGRLEKPVVLVGNILLPLAVVMLVAGASSAIWAAVGNGTVLAIVLFTIAGLAVGHVLGGPSADHSIVLALSTACRHPGLALAIAGAAYPDQRFGATILLYLLVNAVAGFPYLIWQGRRAAAQAA